MFSCLQILEAFLWFVLITLLNVTLIILTLSVSRLLNLLLRLVAFLLFLNPQCLASISRWITASSSWKRFCQIEVDCWRKMRKFDLSLRSSRSSYFATFRHQLTILSKTDALDEEKWLNMLGTFVKDWFRYESHFVLGRDFFVVFFNEHGLLSLLDV